MKLSQNASRAVYDLAVAMGASAFTAAFAYFTDSFPINYFLFLAPFFLLIFNWFFGIFHSLRVAAWTTKAKVLTVSLLLSCLLIYFLGASLSSVVLWFSTSWAPIVLPRIFLNWNTRNKQGFISNILRHKGPVLVVGGAGYIGSTLVGELLKEDFAVRILDNFLYGKESLTEFQNNPKLEVIEGDVTDLMKISEAMLSASAVVHLGGLVGDPACSLDEKFTRHANVIATRMLKEMAISMGVPKFIFASSCSVYGFNEKEVNEESPLNPVSLYAQTKIDSEQELLSCVDETFCPVILRFATVFGDSRRPRFDLVVNLFTAQAMTNEVITVTGPGQWRPFIHVKDVARAIMLVLKSYEDEVRGQIYNVGSSKMNYTIDQVAEIVSKEASPYQKVNVVIKPNPHEDPRNYRVSFAKIKKSLNFDAATSMEEGVREMINGFVKRKYADYKMERYSNLAVTRKALQDFKDPKQAERLYTTLSEKLN